MPVPLRSSALESNDSSLLVQDLDLEADEKPNEKPISCATPRSTLSPPSVSVLRSPRICKVIAAGSSSVNTSTSPAGVSSSTSVTTSPLSSLSSRRQKQAHESFDDNDSDCSSEISHTSSASSRCSVRSSVSDCHTTRLRVAESDSLSSRKKYDQAVKEAVKRGDAAFLCNVLGYEEAVVELCVRQKSTLVKKLLAERPELMVEADMFIPQPGILLNETTTRFLTKAEYIKAFTTYSTVSFDLQVSEAIRMENRDAIQSLPVLKLMDAAKEACRQGKEDLAAFALDRLYRQVPSACENMNVFGKREAPEVVQVYLKAHQNALQSYKKPVSSPRVTLPVSPNASENRKRGQKSNYEQQEEKGCIIS